MRRIIFLALVLGTVFLAVGCKNQAPPDADALLDGTDWDLFMLEEGGKKESAPPGVQINMAFLEGKLSGKAMCNDYSASYILTDTDLTVGEVSATEKYCESAFWESRFLGALKTAETCVLNGQILNLSCSNGVKLYFSKRSLQSIAEQIGAGNTEPAELSAVLALFKDLTPQQMHLYSILLGTNIDVYPFVGETIEPNMYGLFDDASTSIFQQATQLGAYAIGKLGDMYILRVPGNKGSNSISLYTLKNNKLNVEMPLALANDDPSVNIQQDAWLKDLDRDGKAEIIVRQISAPQGQPAQDVIRVFARSADGSYQPSPTLRAKVVDYPLAKLK